MFPNFQLRHIPALITATTTAFGGLWPMFDAPAAMLEFGFPPRIAETPAAAPVFIVGNVRTSIIGTLMLLFYSRGQMDIVDTMMAVTGAYAGVADCYIVWREGRPSWAIFRLVSSGILSACGYFGLTAGR